MAQLRGHAGADELACESSASLNHDEFFFVSLERASVDVFFECCRSVLGLLLRVRCLPSRMSCSSKERVVMGDLCRDHPVMQAGWNVVQ